MKDDPRMNAAPCISALPLDERAKAMIARDRARRDAHMAQYLQGPRPGLLRRLMARVGR